MSAPQSTPTPPLPQPPSSTITSLSSSLMTTSQQQLTTVSSSATAGTTTLQLQQPNSCVSLHSSQSTMAWAQSSPLQFVTATSKPGNNATTNTATATTTFSLIPQQLLQMPGTTMLQMSNGTLPQMLVPQGRPPTPGSSGGVGPVGNTGGGSLSTALGTMTGSVGTGNSAATAGQIVQIIQTPNGPAQFVPTAAVTGACSTMSAARFNPPARLMAACSSSFSR